MNSKILVSEADISLKNWFYSNKMEICKDNTPSFLRSYKCKNILATKFSISRLLILLEIKPSLVYPASSPRFEFLHIPRGEYWLLILDANQLNKIIKLYYFYTLKALWDSQGKIKMYYGMSRVKKQISKKSYITTNFSWALHLNISVTLCQFFIEIIPPHLSSYHSLNLCGHI